MARRTNLAAPLSVFGGKATLRYCPTVGDLLIWGSFCWATPVMRMDFEATCRCPPAASNRGPSAPGLGTIRCRPQGCQDLIRRRACPSHLYARPLGRNFILVAEADYFQALPIRTPVSKTRTPLITTCTSAEVKVVFMLRQGIHAMAKSSIATTLPATDVAVQKLAIWYAEYVQGRRWLS